MRFRRSWAEKSLRVGTACPERTEADVVYFGEVFPSRAAAAGAEVEWAELRGAESGESRAETAGFAALQVDAASRSEGVPFSVNAAAGSERAPEVVGPVGEGGVVSLSVVPVGSEDSGTGLTENPGVGENRKPYHIEVGV